MNVRVLYPTSNTSSMRVCEGDISNITIIRCRRETSWTPADLLVTSCRTSMTVDYGTGPFYEKSVIMYECAAGSWWNKRKSFSQSPRFMKEIQLIFNIRCQVKLLYTPPHCGNHGVRKIPSNTTTICSLLTFLSPLLFSPGSEGSRQWPHRSPLWLPAGVRLRGQRLYRWLPQLPALLFKLRRPGLRLPWWLGTSFP